MTTIFSFSQFSQHHLDVCRCRADDPRCWPSAVLCAVSLRAGQTLWLLNILSSCRMVMEAMRVNKSSSCCLVSCQNLVFLGPVYCFDIYVLKMEHCHDPVVSRKKVQPVFSFLTLFIPPKFSFLFFVTA